MDNHCAICGTYLTDTGRVVCEKCEKPKDLVEVTRCKNCVACTSFDEYGIGWCMEHDTYIYEKDFCSYGKEK